MLTERIWAGGFPRTTLGWGSALPVSSRCIWEDTALFFQASYPIFFLSFFFFEAKQEHVCDLIFFLGSVLLLKIAAFLERAAPPLPAG